MAGFKESCLKIRPACIVSEKCLWYPTTLNKWAGRIRVGWKNILLHKKSCVEWIFVHRKDKPTDPGWNFLSEINKQIYPTIK